MKLLQKFVYALLLCLMFAGFAHAQLVKGRDFLVIGSPQPTESGKKVEVLEFFWYGCPHCAHLQPSLAAWLKRKPADVDFRRVPAAFDDSWLQLARAYYALEAMGLVDKLHHDLFAAIHDQRTLDPRVLLKDPKTLFDWVAARGVDRQKFAATYNSFAVTSRTQRIKDLTKNYDIPGTPALVVDGKYLIAPSLDGYDSGGKVDYDRFFKGLDLLIAQARKERASPKR